MNDKVRLTIDSTVVEVTKGTTIYTAAKTIGIDIPIFCYHDRMPPFGACRMCLVEVEKMGKLQTACTLEVAEGMVVKTESKKAVEGREGIVEFLLINHPLDCPICDRGGECPLQENAYSHGPGHSRFYEEKRHFEKPIDLGPVLTLDRERCIVCARCTRFSDIVSGDNALEFIDRGYKTEVGTPGGEPVDSKFIGNTIMICPVGALTSSVYRFRARPWDNDSTESCCTLCPVGCSMILDSRDGEIMRTRSKENVAVNDVWLCDKGWFGYEFAYHAQRLRKPLIRQGGTLREASWDEALALVANKIAEVADNNSKAAGWGGNPLTVEENYLFQKIMRQGAKTAHVDHRVGMPLFAPTDEGIAPGMKLSFGDCEALTHVVLCGADITEEFPLLWLRLKQAINKGAKVLFVGHYAPEISRHLTNTILHAPGDEIAILQQQLPLFLSDAAEKKGSRCALFLGSQYLASTNRKPIVAEVRRLCSEIPNLTVNALEGRGNSLGARQAGMHPSFSAGGNKADVTGLNVIEVLEHGAESGFGLLYVAGGDPASKYPSKLWSAFRNKLDFLIVQDLFMTETAHKADVVLPTFSFIEKGGSFLNIEGRVQKLLPGKEQPESLLSDLDIFEAIGKRLEIDVAIEKSFLDNLNTLLHTDIDSSTEKEGNTPSTTISDNAILKASFAHALFDGGNRMQHNTHLSRQLKAPKVRIHPQEADPRGLADGQQVTLRCGNSTTITGEVALDANVATRTVVIPLGFEQLRAHELGPSLKNGMPVEVQSR